MNKNKKLLPSNDYLFKRIFGSKGNEKLLINLIESILNRKIYTIKVQKQFEIDKKYEEIKKGTIDVQAIINNEEIIDLEIQVGNMWNLKERMERYMTGLYYEQFKKGDTYGNAKSVTVICIIVNGILRSNNPLDTISLRSNITYKKASDNLNICYVQVSKILKENIKKQSDLTDWLHFLVQDKEVKEIMKRNSNVMEAQIIYEEATPEDEKKWMAELEEKYYYEVACARTAGLKEGEKRGEKRGEKHGINKGRSLEKLDLAKKMLEDGISVERISKITGLSTKDLKNLLEQTNEKV